MNHHDLQASYARERRVVAGFFALRRPDLARVHVARAAELLDAIDGVSS